MNNPLNQRRSTTVAEDFGQVRKRAADDADSIFNQVERKPALTLPPAQAAGGDDDLMSTPRKS